MMDRSGQTTVAPAFTASMLQSSHGKALTNATINSSSGTHAVRQPPPPPPSSGMMRTSGDKVSTTTAKAGRSTEKQSIKKKQKQKDRKKKKTTASEKVPLIGTVKKAHMAHKMTKGAASCDRVQL